MITTTDAIVLQTRRFRESSKIVALYSREHGKMSVVARGAMEVKSKFGATLQPMAHLSMVIYRKEGRDLHNLSKAESIERFPVLMGDLERISAGLAIVELVNASMHDEERNDPLFDTIVESLRALNDPSVHGANVQLWFMVRLTEILGYAVRTDECGVCGEPFALRGSDVPYSLSMGAPLCSEHRDATAYRPLAPAAFDLLGQLQVESVVDAGRRRIDPRVTSNLNDALTSFIRFHVEGLRRLNVTGVAAKVLGEAG